MKDIEKNDVDISKLWQWGTSLELETPRKTITVWIKVLGDADINRARIYALRKSAEMRAKLLDLDSDERIALIPPLDTGNHKKVVELLLTLRIKEITDVALKDVDIKYPKDLKSDATLEEQEKHQAIIDGFPEYVSDLHDKAITKEADKERKRLSKLPMEQLNDLYVETLLDHVCESEMYRAFQDRSVWLACYQDENYILPLFAEFEDFANLPTNVKNQLIDFYGTLSIDIDTLKK
jgi:hypothetical protein